MGLAPEPKFLLFPRAMRHLKGVDAGLCQLAGSRSCAAARALYAWIEDVIQAAHPWMSDKDIEKGAVWSEEIYGALEQSEFGIISVTAERQHAPWVLFEAGALTAAMTKSRVCPVCIDLAKTGSFRSTRGVELRLSGQSGRHVPVGQIDKQSTRVKRS